MRYSIIAGTSQTLAGAHGDCESQKAADGERHIDQVEHEPIPFVDVGPRNGGTTRKGAMLKARSGRKECVKNDAGKFDQVEPTTANQR
jgi:hypothetical protein